MADNGSGGSMSGLSANEAREYHRLFMASFIAYVVIALIAHILLWSWRPWFNSPDSVASLIEGARVVADHVVMRLT